MTYSKYYRILIFRALSAGVMLDFILPFTYNEGLFTKEVFSWGNPYLVLFYTLLVLVLFSAGSKKDIEQVEKRIIVGVDIDKPREIPKTILKSILELLLGIVFLFLTPLIGGAFLFWSGLPMELVVFMCMGYIAFLVYLGKTYYWND